ncbi:MFS transporter [Nocardia otitidiscaviarum]|uniref:MFS transporter n=1 Tax=Nocardia otitidiscaviarum TaxID=1823 RepID=A0A516NQC4_9NOCA|nr:MFS transporter [Nocardia otitidiscaviarum]MBF6182867.1 MFS transporter [Nocardia otitidiscaviarum]MCP9620221.1 MFS transporter [Nocardia otitidiscaviarum]QDP81098.1 MFS transporter [Nocardia otitidiscaviarum]
MSTSVETTTPSGVGDEDTGRLDGASKLRIFGVLAVIVLFTEVAPMQYVMVSAALRQIAPSFPTVGANLNWAIIIFGVIGAATSPLIGKLSDIWGKKKMFLTCGVLFMIGCVICAVTSNWLLFLFGRGLQATAIATAVISYGLIRDLMPRRLVPVGIGIAATGLGVSALAGPLIGGWIVEHNSWRAIFWFLFIFTAVMIPLVILVVPESKLRVPQRLDVVGAALLGAGAVLTLIYLDNGQAWGWTEPTSLAYLIGGLVLLALFPVVELRVKQPIMDMKLLFTPRVSVVLFIALLASFMIGYQSYAIGYMTQSPPESAVAGEVTAATWEQVKAGAMQQAQAAAEEQARAQLPPGVELPPGAVQVPEEAVLAQLPPDMVRVQMNPGYSYGEGFSLLEFATHLALAQAVISMIFGFVAGLWIRRSGARIPLIVALCIFVGAAVAYAALGHGWVTLALISAVFGIAFGIYYAATPNLIVEAVPAQQQGVSAGMLGVMQAMGVAIGLAVATAFLHANPVAADVTVTGQPTVTSEIPLLFSDRGYEITFWVIAATSLIALLGAIWMKHGRTPATGGTAY